MGLMPFFDIGISLYCFHLHGQGAKDHQVLQREKELLLHFLLDFRQKKASY